MKDIKPYHSVDKCAHCGKTKDEHYHDKRLNKFWCRFGGVIAVICTYKPLE